MGAEKEKATETVTKLTFLLTGMMMITNARLSIVMTHGGEKGFLTFAKKNELFFKEVTSCHFLIALP